MTTATYAAALELAEQLTSEERQRLLEELDQGVTAPRTLAGAATAVPDTGSGPGLSVRPGLEADLDAIDSFAAEVSAAWDGDITAVEAVKEQRRDL